MKPISDIAQPSRRTVETLFKELSRIDTDLPSYKRYQKACDDEHELRDKLLAAPIMRRVEKRMRVEHGKWRKEREKLARLVSAVRTKYLAQGLTKAVRRELDDLVFYVVKLLRGGNDA